MATATKYTQNTRSIAIQTPLGKDALLLRRFEGEEGISRLFHFDLELLAPEASVDQNAIVGRPATIGLRLANGEDRYFNGIVSRLSLVGGDGPFTVYRAELVPWTWLLTRTTDCRVFQNLPVPAIVEKVFTDFGLLDFKNRLTRSYPAREYCVQYRETDFNFVSRLMEQCGIYYFFEHQNGKHTLVMADSPVEHRPSPALGQAKYRAAKEDQYEPEVISAWSVSRELRPAKYSLASYNFETPNASLSVQVDSPLAPPETSKCEVYDYPGGYLKRADGEDLVRIRIEEQETQVVTIRGAGSCRGMTAGCRFDLIDHPHQELNQPYVVTGVSHAASETSYVAGRQEKGGEYRNTFTAIPVTVPFRPPRLSPRPVIHGVQTAIVVGKKGEELWVDKHGRVKVQFFWDREGKRDENSSCWVRVSQNWAGKRWGAMFLPRIGQEVLVEFLEGDPDAPIITGRVYNGDQMPPYDLPGEQAKTTLKSSSSKGGRGFNEWRFDDKTGAEQVFIHGQRDLDLVIERQARELIGEERHLIVTGSRVEQVGKEQHLKTGGDLVEDIGGDRYTSAAKGLYLRGARLVIEAGEITLKGAGGFVTISGGGVNVQGTIVNINSGGAAGAGATKAARVPNRAASASPGDASGVGGGGEEPAPGAPVDIVELYRRAVKGEMSEADKKEYEKALNEYEAAEKRGDVEAMRQAKAKLIALEKKASKLPEKDRDEYEQALQELEAARDRGDTEGMKKAQAKLDAILARNGIPVPVAGVTQPVPIATQSRTGAVRLQQNSYCDDGGPYLSLGVSMFWLPWGWKHDRDRTIKNLDWLRARGVLYVRAFAAVGPGGGWEDRMTDPTQPDFQSLIADVTAYVRSIGMRTQWTIFATVDNTPTRDLRQQTVDRVLAAIDDKRDAIEAIEVVNESDHTGWEGRYDELRQYAQRVRDRGWPIVSTSCYPEPEFHEHRAPGTESSYHFDRDSSREGGPWRYVRQPWEARGPYRNNEPKGPQSSVDADDDPVRQTMAAYVTWLCNGASYVLHSGAGVRGGGQADLARGRSKNFWETPNLDTILTGLQRGRAALPPDLPSWPSRVHSHRKHQGEFPWETAPLDPLFDTNYMRIYVTFKGNRFVAMPLFVKGPVPLQAIRPMDLDVRHPVTWAALRQLTLEQGATLTLDPSWCPQGVVIFGTYR